MRPTKESPSSLLQPECGEWLLQQSLNRKDEVKQQSCVPSSCGHIHNISYPFRLNTDPEQCGANDDYNELGNNHYELGCEGNQTIFKMSSYDDSSSSMKYYVQAINYNNSTIRLVGSDVREQLLCSLPQTSVTRNNVPFSARARQITIFSCPSAINFPVSVEISNCLNRSNVSMGRHTYATMSQLFPSDLRVGCSLDLMSLTSWRIDDAIANFSILDLHNALAYGFELSWFRILCGGCMGECEGENSWNIRCKNYTCNVYNFGFFKKEFCGSWSYFQDRNLPSLTCVLPVLTRIVPWMLPIAGLCVVARMVLFPCVVVFLMIELRRRHLSFYDAIESFLHSENSFMPIRYPYSNIKTMTKNFNEKLGQGGYGSVYKGKLRSGPDVAVKMLNKSKDDGKDFVNEVATIGRIHHVNVVRLIGYCAERSKRALVYDFMPNGSLDMYIMPRGGVTMLSWERKFEIALGVARGIEYLHRGCDIQILHFDIKPHNILLDENFTPKLSDFGLAKLYPTDNSIVTLTAARGTIGYVAPELINRSIGPISYKADVYSFGMLLIEMAGLKTNLADRDQDMSSQYFPYWIYDKFDKEKEIVVDDMHDGENKIVKKVTLVALWCIQLNPLDRPSMTKVVEMLDGDLQALKTPPRPSESLQPPCSAFNLSSCVSSTESAKLLDSCSDSAEIDVITV